MRIMLIGAGGFIGRQVLAELLAHGHEVVAVVRRVGGLQTAVPAAHFVAVDLAGATRPQDWAPHLEGIELIVNAAGLLRGRDMTAVHVDGPRALYAAARDAGVRRVVLISAISARDDAPTDYARTKLAGETVLRASAVPYTILRPSLVYGDGSYGGTSLLRGLAGLPLLTPLAGDGRYAFTPLHVADLARAVRLMCEDERFAGAQLEPVGPETMTLRDLLARYRAWLGFGRVPMLSVPMPLMRALGWIGDRVGDGPVSGTSLAQMVAGNAGDSAAFAAATGLAPRSLDAALAAHPAQVQDRWHARLFFLAPAVRWVLAALWLASALLGVCFGAARTAQLVAALGLPSGWADALRVGASLLDVGIAALVLLDRTARWSTIAQCLVVIGYTLAIGWVLPGLWVDPLGPLLKNLPILALILVHGAIADRR